MAGSFGPEMGRGIFPDLAPAALHRRRPDAIVYFTEQSARNNGVYNILTSSIGNNDVVNVAGVGIGVKTRALVALKLPAYTLFGIGTALRESLVSSGSPFQAELGYQQNQQRRVNDQTLIASDLQASSWFGAVELLHSLSEQGTIPEGPFGSIAHLLLQYADQLETIEAPEQPTQLLSSQPQARPAMVAHAEPNDQPPMMRGLGGTLIPAPRTDDPLLRIALDGDRRDR